MLAAQRRSANEEDQSGPNQNEHAPHLSTPPQDFRPSRTALCATSPFHGEIPASMPDIPAVLSLCPPPAEPAGVYGTEAG